MVEKIAERYHGVVDAAWRALEKAHDLVAELRAHRLFPNRKIFGGAVASVLTAGARWVLAKTGVDLGAWVVPAAGFITAYLFSEPKVQLLDGEDHAAIETEERVTRERAARGVAAGTSASSHRASPPRS